MFVFLQQVLAVLAQNVDNVKKLFMKTIELIHDEKWDETIQANQVSCLNLFLIWIDLDLRYLYEWCGGG